jgi:hypothetical protein
MANTTYCWSVVLLALPAIIVAFIGIAASLTDLTPSSSPASTAPHCQPTTIDWLLWPCASTQHQKPHTALRTRQWYMCKHDIGEFNALQVAADILEQRLQSIANTTTPSIVIESWHFLSQRHAPHTTIAMQVAYGNTQHHYQSCFSVVVKLFGARSEHHASHPSSDTIGLCMMAPNSTRQQEALIRERSALLVLEQLSQSRTPDNMAWPRYIAHSDAHGLVVMSHIANAVPWLAILNSTSHTTTSDTDAGIKEQQAEQQHCGGFASFDLVGAGLAHVHAQTLFDAEYAQQVFELCVGASDVADADEPSTSALFSASPMLQDRKRIQQLNFYVHRVASAFGVSYDPDALNAEFRSIAHTIAPADGRMHRWFALSSSDLCSDNVLLRANPNGDSDASTHCLASDARTSVHVVDFSNAAFRHALLDLANVQIGFSSCWAVRQLTSQAQHSIEQSYLRQLKRYHSQQSLEQQRRKGTWLQTEAFDIEMAHVLGYTALLDITNAHQAAPLLCGKRTTITCQQRVLLSMSQLKSACTVVRSNMLGQRVEIDRCAKVIPTLSHVLHDVAQALRYRWVREHHGGRDIADVPYWPSLLVSSDE